MKISDENLFKIKNPLVMKYLHTDRSARVARSEKPCRPTSQNKRSFGIHIFNCLEAVLMRIRRNYKNIDIDS